MKQLFSRRDDVTLANPLGPPVRGWDQVEKTTDHATSQLREGEPVRYERISGYETEGLAYTLVIERVRAKVGGSVEMGEISLRVTTIFRREDISPGRRRMEDRSSSRRPHNQFAAP